MNDPIRIELLEEKKNRIYSRISFWVSLILSISVCVYYFIVNPPDEGATKKMRLFIAAHAKQVSEFLRMTREEKEAYARKNQHPFYKNYIEASENMKTEIDGMVHKSLDYKPAQYWFNMLFLWVIFFSMFWFIGLMTEAIIQLVRQENKKVS